MPEPITTLIVATAPLWYEAVTDFIKERIMGAGKDLIETSMEDGVKRGITTAATHIRNPQTTSFTNAFNKACNTFLGEYELDRNLAQAVIKILSYAHDKRLREMNQDVLLATIFTDIPRMAPIEQYCQRAIAFDNLLANSVVTYSQLEIARAVRKFFEELQRELMLTAEWQEIVVAFRSLQLQAKLAGESDLIELEKEYRSYLQERYEYLDLKGFSPRVSGRVISLRLPQIYTDLEFEEGRPNVSSFAEDDLTLISDKRFFELDWQRQLDLLEKRYARLEALKPSTKHLKLFDILNSRKIVVLGEPGSGKTTLARYITYTLASNSYDRIGPELTRLLPILVRVANYGRALEKEPTLHLVDYICNELTPGFGILLKHELEFGRCLVILDGLDEVAEISQRQIVAEQIEDLVAKLSTNQFLVTSRPIGYQSVQLSGDFRHVTLQHMNEKEQEQFVNLWHKEMRARGAGQAEVTQFKAEPDDLLKTMKSKPSISKLASNPLLLTIIVLMYWRGTKLPDRRVDIYASATETLIENWPLRQRGIDLDFEQMKSILAPVALAILSSTVSGVIPERNLMPVLLKVVEDVHGGTRAEIQLICNNVLRDLSEHSGIFLERGRDEFDYPVFGFLHQTFGEYLAAVALAEQWNVGQIELATYVHRARWREVILLMAGVLGTQGRAVASRFISQLFELNSPFESILHRDLLLTLDCLADDLRIQPNLRNEILSHGVALLSHEVFELRQIAQSRIRQLKGTDHEGAVAIHLKKLLTEITAQPKSSLREEIRLAIADVLCHLGESEYVRSIIWEISENPHVFRNITNSVQGIVTKLRVLYWPNQSINWLADLFTSERPIRPRLVIGESPAEIFIRTADGTDIQFIDRFEHSDINNLFNELKKRVADEEVISRLEWAYLQIDPSNTISKLKILIQPDNDRQVRFLAAKKLIEFGYDKEAISTLYDLSSGVDTNAFTAVNKLIELGQPVAEVHSVYELAALQQTRGTIQLARKLTEIGQRTVGELLLLLHLVTSDLPQVQWEAIENLSDLGHKELAISAAKMVAYMPGHHYRYESAEFVLDYERENGSFDEVIQMFVDLAYDFTNKDQEKAIARLVTFAEVEQILPVLVRALQSSDPAGQYRMAGALVLGGMFSIDLKQELASSILEFRIERLQSKTDKFDINRFDFLNKALVFTEERIQGKNKLATSINLILCNELGRKDNAKKIIERINENSQKDNVADLILAQTFIKFGETQSAIKMVLSILNDKSISTNIALFAIDILENLGTDTISEILFKIGADSEISDTRVKAVNAFMRYQIPELREKIEKLLLTEPEDGNLREALIETINGYPYDTTKEILIHFLQDKSGRVRAAVANALQKFGTEDVVELLINKLSDDDERVRITATRSLQIIGRPLPAQPLAKLIFDDPSVEVRINATLALKLAPWLDSKQYLLKAIIDPIDIIRESALDLLLEQDERDVIPLLISYSKDIQIPSQYRASIISALATHFGKTYSLLFQELISDPSSEVSIAAIKAVGEIGEMQIVEDLVAVALPEESVEKSVAVIDTLACCQSVTRIKHISEYLNSSNHQVRKSVVSALVFNFDYDIVPIFIDMFSRESDEEVRKSLIEGIFWLAPDESVDILPKALVDEHWVVRETAAHCMGLLGHINHVEHLCCALFDNDIDVRIAATRSLGAIGDHRAIIPLHKAFSHQQLGVRAAAALALGRTGDETVVKEITASILSGRIPGGEGCLAISYIGSSTSITALKTILEYANRHTKLAALNCLARLDPKIVLESQHSPMLTSTLNLEMLALIPLAFHFINEPGMAEQAYSQALRNIIESHHSPSEKSAILMRLIIDSFELGYFSSCTSLLKYLISYDEVGNMVNLGIAYRVMGEFNLASEMYERSMSKPKFFDSSLFNGLGILAYQQQNSILARDYFGKAYKLGISQLQKSGFKNFWFEEHNLHMMLVTLLGLNRGNEALTLLRRSLPILRWQMGVVKELLWDIEQIAKFQPSTPQVAQIVDETQKLYLELSKQNRGPFRSSWVGNF